LFAWFFQRDQYTASGFLVSTSPSQSRDNAAVYSAAFDLDDDFLAVYRFASRQRFFPDPAWNIFSLRLVEIEQAVHAAIRAFTFAFS
jgi:hypothetical protein